MKQWGLQILFGSSIRHFFSERQITRGGSAEGTSQTDTIRIQKNFGFNKVNSTQIRTQNYQNFGLTPPSGQKLYLKITIFSKFFHFLTPE